MKVAFSLQSSFFPHKTQIRDSNTQPKVGVLGLGRVRRDYLEVLDSSTIHASKDI